MIIYILLLSIHWIHLSAFLDFYIDTNETKRVLGIPAELYYVRNGSINTYATQFRVPIPSFLNDMRYTWQRRKGPGDQYQNLGSNALTDDDCPKRSPGLRYAISFSGMDPEVLQPPIMDIPAQGEVPLRRQTFTVVVQCVPDVTAEIDFDIIFNISSCDPKEVSYIKLLRKKMCVLSTDLNQVIQEKKLKGLRADSAGMFVSKRKPSATSLIGADGNPVVDLPDEPGRDLKTRRRGAAIISPNPLSQGNDRDDSLDGPHNGEGSEITSLPQRKKGMAGSGSHSFAIVLIASAVGVAVLAAAGVAAYYHHFPARDRASRFKTEPSSVAPPSAPKSKGPQQRMDTGCPRNSSSMSACPANFSIDCTSATVESSSRHAPGPGSLPSIGHSNYSGPCSRPTTTSGKANYGLSNRGTYESTHITSDEGDQVTRTNPAAPRPPPGYGKGITPPPYPRDRPTYVTSGVPRTANLFRDQPCRKSLSLEAGQHPTPHASTRFDNGSFNRSNLGQGGSHSLLRKQCCPPPPIAPDFTKYRLISPRPVPRTVAPFSHRDQSIMVHDSSINESDSHTPLLLRRKLAAPSLNENVVAMGDSLGRSYGHYERPQDLVVERLPLCVHVPPSHKLSPLPVSQNMSPSSSKVTKTYHQESAPPPSSLTPRYFAFQNIRFGNVLVEGTFGEIRQAYLHETRTKGSYEVPIIVKMIKSLGLATASQVELMNHESAVCSLKNLQHPNVISLLGFSHLNEEEEISPVESVPVLIYPHMGQGILKLFLMRCHHSETHFHQLSTKDFVNIGVQVLYGLQALHCNGILHKDIATRNCYITDNLMVKIGDTALSRDVFPGDYCCLGDNENRPLKWMALESLLFKSYSVASDIWSIGVTLWEIVTFAETPYADVDPFEIGSYLQHGFRLPQPQNCPDEIYSVMLSCLASSPEERPHISLIISALLRFQKTLDRFI